jgi:uncharacterized protein YndB with AHSA1/START domain
MNNMRHQSLLLGLAIVIGQTARAADDPKQWVDDGVTIRTSTEPMKQQDFTIDIPAPVEQVWRALATAEGVQEYFPAKPKIELKVGGRYEIFAGSGNKVLSFIPRKLLMVTGSAPPQFPDVRKGGTWGVYRFDPLDDGKRTRLRLAVVGWKQGKQWDDAFAYFTKNNPVFLRMIRKRFVDGPLPPAPKQESEAKPTPIKIIHKETIVSSSPQEAWKCWTTSDGMKTFFASESKIELTPGGSYELYLGPQSETGKRGSEGCKVLGYLPNEVLSFDWNAPPKFPEVRKERTCVVVQFEPAGEGRTKVTLDHHGFGGGPQWDEVYKYFDSARGRRARAPEKEVRAFRRLMFQGNLLSRFWRTARIRSSKPPLYA